MPGVYNLHNGNVPADAVRVDRSTIYGNPFHVGIDGTREQVFEKHRIWINEPEQAWLRDKIRAELRGCDLVCHCFPELCHATTLIEIANAPIEAVV